MSLSSPPTPEQIRALLDGPAAPPPPGVVANWVNPPSLRTELMATLTIAIVFSTIFVATRIYTNHFVIRAMHWDDYSIIAGYAIFMAFCGECFVTLPVGSRHIWDEKLSELIRLLYLANIIEILYMPCIIFIKTGILLQYLRIFVPSRRQNAVTYWSIVSVIAVNVVFYLIIMFFTIFTCTPREAIWNKLLPQKCFDISKLLLSQAAFNLISDIVILLLPQYSIWRLHMTGKRKSAVSALFGLGAVVCIITALRVYSTAQLIQTSDVTWYLAPTAMWAIAEVTLAIMCSCLPVFPKFFQSMTGNLSRVSRYGRSYGSQRASELRAEVKDKTGDKSMDLPLRSPPPNHARYIGSRQDEESYPTWYNEYGSDQESQASQPAPLEHELAPRSSKSFSMSHPDRIVRTVHIELTHSGEKSENYTRF